MANCDNRQTTIRYLMQMADEMKKMAHGAFAPSLALLFDMAGDEARHFLAEAEKMPRRAAAEPARQCGAAPLSAAAKDSAPAAPSRLSGRRRLSRQSGNHAAIMANKASRKLKLHQTEI